MTTRRRARYLQLVRYYAKATVPLIVVAVAGAIAQGLIVGRTAAEVTVILGVVASAGVGRKRNGPRPGPDTGSAALSVLLVVVLALLVIAWASGAF